MGRKPRTSFRRSGDKELLSFGAPPRGITFELPGPSAKLIMESTTPHFQGQTAHSQCPAPPTQSKELVALILDQPPLPYVRSRSRPGTRPARGFFGVREELTDVTDSTARESKCSESCFSQDAAARIRSMSGISRPASLRSTARCSAGTSQVRCEFPVAAGVQRDAVPRTAECAAVSIPEGHDGEATHFQRAN